MLEPGSSSSLRDLLGAPLTKSVPDIRALPARQVREAAELDFKETLYGTSDADKRELAADIALMRNGRGGVIVLGVKDESGVAVPSYGLPAAGVRGPVLSSDAPRTRAAPYRASLGSRGR